MFTLKNSMLLMSVGVMMLSSTLAQAEPRCRRSSNCRPHNGNPSTSRPSAPRNNNNHSRPAERREHNSHHENRGHSEHRERHVYRNEGRGHAVIVNRRDNDYNQWREHNSRVVRNNRSLWNNNYNVWSNNNYYRNNSDRAYRHDMYWYWRYNHRPHWNHPEASYVYYRHNPYRHHHRHHHSWQYSINYGYSLPFSSIYWWNWIRVRVAFDNGYRVVNGYPYYVYDGYSHRYSAYDNCNYELVDGYTNSTVKRFGSNLCNISYDMCAYERDNANYNVGQSRYFCSERFEYDSRYNYNWNVNSNFYSDLGNGQDLSDQDYDNEYGLNDSENY